MSVRDLLHPIRARRDRKAAAARYAATHDLTRIPWAPSWLAGPRDWPPEVR